ncbi:MAG: hypothetical protein IKD70_00955 [Eggerthellaceae bacterium]|nr:hypothetical protein [Eggerthellaceae bacterium]
MELPVDLKSVLEAAKTVEEARNIPVGMCVIVDETAPESLLDMVEELLEPLSPGARVVYDELCKGSHSYDDTTDFVVIVAGGNRRVGWFADAVRAEGIPVAVVAASADFVAERAREAGNPIPEGDVLDGTDAEKLAEAMGRWLIAVGRKKKLAIAQAFACARRPLAVESIKATALQNAAVGGVVIIPGADMPVMTLNQIKMLLQIAAAFGEPMDIGRVKELAGVVAGGFLARTAARELLGLVPVGGWAIKGGIGYSATMAMGYAALNYFEGGGGLAGVGAIAGAAGDVAAKAARGTKGALSKGKDKVGASKPVRAAVSAAATVAGAVSAARKKAAASRAQASEAAIEKAQVKAAMKAEKAEKAAAKAEAKAVKASAKAPGVAQKPVAKAPGKATKPANPVAKPGTVAHASSDTAAEQA